MLWEFSIFTRALRSHAHPSAASYFTSQVPPEFNQLIFVKWAVWRQRRKMTWRLQILRDPYPPPPSNKPTRRDRASLNCYLWADFLQMHTTNLINEKGGERSCQESSQKSKISPLNPVPSAKVFSSKIRFEYR